MLSCSLEFTRYSVIQEIPRHYSAPEGVTLCWVHGRQAGRQAVSHLSLFWARGINPFHTVPSHDCKVHTNIIFPFTDYRTMASYPSVFSTKTLHNFLLPLTCYMSRPSHFLHLTRCNHTLHQEPRLMFLFPFACEADPFCSEVKCVCVCVSVRCQKARSETYFVLRATKSQETGKLQDDGIHDLLSVLILCGWSNEHKQTKSKCDILREESTYTILVRKHVRKKALGWPRRRYEDNIKTDLKEIGWENVKSNKWSNIGTSGGLL